MSPTHPTVSAAVSLHTLSPSTFRSTHPIEGQGGGGSMGYGGFTIAFGLHAAFQHLTPAQRTHLRLYSALGTFLGPSNTTAHLTATVTSLRNTRTFATRHITISQPQASGDGDPRIIMSLTADFMAPEPGSFMAYAIRPLRAYSGPEESLGWEELGEMARRAGVGEERIRGEREPMRHLEAKFEMRSAREGFNGQSARGLVGTGTRIEMDGWRETERTNVEWYRARERIGSYIDALVCIPYILDSHIAADAGDLSRINWREEGAACSSLEFALRLFVNELDFNDWVMRENKSKAAGLGRTFQEACLFDRRGNLIAMLSEQCILRPKKEFARI